MPQRVDMEPGFLDYEARISANSNQNNRNVKVGSTENVHDTFNMTKLRRDVSAFSVFQCYTSVGSKTLFQGNLDTGLR